MKENLSFQQGSRFNMALLQDYLRVLPTVDKEVVRKEILKNKETLSIKNLTEEEFERLIQEVAIEEEPQTNPVKLSKKIMAEEFNEFYSNVELDLLHLFMEQNLLEGISENYDRIYSGNLNDLKEQLNQLKEKTAALDMEKEGEDGLIVQSYSFEPSGKSHNVETKGLSASDSLWIDRDGTLLDEAEVDRTFHKYYCGLSKKKQNNLLQNDDGETTAKIEVSYTSPYTVDIENPSYGIDKTVDGNQDTYWYSVSLKPSNGLDSTSIV